MTISIERQFIDIQHKINRVGALVGNTPLYKISNVWNKPGVEIFAKLEWQQIGGSVKSRPAFNIIKEAILKGELKAGQHLLDATSGNTGIAYAAIGAALGIPVTLCLPENASEQRKQILKSLGVNIIFTSKFDGTDGSQLKAKELFREQPDRYYYADQYANDNNWKAHYLTTAEEIWAQTQGRITHFVAGLGTTGTFTGTSRRLKEYNPDIELVALHPNTAMHSLEGWKHLETAIVPKIYDDQVATQHREADTYEAFETLKLIAQREGLLVSPSAAANLAGAIALSKEIDQGVIVTTFADDASKYGEVLQQIF
ncbi:MAG: pyridoxal-phosphate dependent enzyme [Bacteroidota bacterium]